MVFFGVYMEPLT